jgi:aminoglycoside 3-N-acetyltransferase I
VNAAAVDLRVLAAGDAAQLRAMLEMFGRAFDDLPTYCARQPDDAYLDALLGSDGFVAVAARVGPQTVGGIAAYVLRKFEQARTELYLYDLAVDARWRRRGIATAMIERLRGCAAERGAYVIFVQADRDDAAAIALYEKLGRREDVLHFDIDPAPVRA